MILTQHDRLFVLTGAGVSAESGLATFRGSGGLWNGYRVDQVATPEAWHADPELVWRFYSMRRRDALAAKPNAAHAGPGSDRAKTRRPFLSLHAERRRSTRARRFPSRTPYARQPLRITLRGLQLAFSTIVNSTRPRAIYPHAGSAERLSVRTLSGLVKFRWI